MSRRRLNPDEWKAIWDAHYFKGSTMMILENLSKKIGISLSDLKERIQTPTERQEKRDLQKHT